MGQTDTRLYKVAVTLGGNYVHGRQYDVLTQVFYAREDGGDGKSYVSRKANKNVIPGTDPTVWQLVSDTGDSAYQAAVRNGYTGTEEEWLASLVGDPGIPAGFGTPTASFDETEGGVPSVDISSTGPDTAKVFGFSFHNIKGLPGNPGEAGKSPVIGQNGNWFLWDEETEQYVDSGYKAAGTNGVGFQSVSSQQDGTLVILLTDGNTVTIDLNHNHPQYTKCVYLEDEYDYPEDPEDDVLYLIDENGVHSVVQEDSGDSGESESE